MAGMESAFPVARMRELDGATELAAATAVAASTTRPEAVTAVLSAMLDTLGGEPATPDVLRALPCGTREWLLQCAAARLNPALRWFEALCRHCGKPFDLSIDLSRPVTRVPDNGTPSVTVETSLGARSFTIPTGEHEERLACAGVSADPRRDFACFCGLSPSAGEDAKQFDEHDLQLIDEALESASPDIADEATARCPACLAETTCRVDPLLFAFPRENDILLEVHLLASAYGWRHDAILKLPSRHRTAYAAMITRERRGFRQIQERR